jgi:hypothetical protein
MTDADEILNAAIEGSRMQWRRSSAECWLFRSAAGPETVGDRPEVGLKTGSSTILNDCCTTRSVTVGIPSGRDSPPGLSINTRSTGQGRYVLS